MFETSGTVKDAAMQPEFYATAERDGRTKFYCLPTRVVWTQAGAGKIEQTDALLTTDERYCVLSPGAPTGPALVLDFGREVNGGVLIDVASTRPETSAKVRLRFGESVSEVMGEPNNDHAIHDFVLNLPSMGRQEIGNTGFRFIRLDLLDAKNEMLIRSIRAAVYERELEYRGSFECSDPLLNQIWTTGARTVQLCCQDHILDGIKRDRYVWLGDLHAEMHIIAGVFGGIDLVPQSLDLVRDRTGTENWMNGISSYSLWWIICVWEWYEYTGDLRFMQSQISYLTKLIERLAKYVDASGREKLDGRFLEWGSATNPTAIDEGYQALFVWAMKAAGWILGAVGDGGTKATCEGMVKLLSSVPTPAIDSKAVNALRVLAGIADAQAMNETCFRRDADRNLSPWFGYYILQARAMANDHAGCLDLIRSYWGGMLSLGATSFWEHFDVRWLENAARIDEITPPGKHDVHVEYGDHCFKGLRHSLCHGWSGGPTVWLSKEVLGIRMVEPGFRKADIRPNLAGLGFARGAFPTPFGPITVEHARKTDGGVETHYTAPPGVQIVD